MVEFELERIAELDLLSVVHNKLVVLQREALGVVDARVDTVTERDLRMINQSVYARVLQRRECKQRTETPSRTTVLLGSGAVYNIYNIFHSGAIEQLHSNLALTKGALCAL